MENIDIEKLAEEEVNNWKCPSCNSNSIALNVEKEHQHFANQYRELRQLMRCCNCQSKFVFEYQISNVIVHTIKEISQSTEEILTDINI